MGETVRTDRFRYTAWVGVRNGVILAQELYDHLEDPIEATNLANNKDFSNELARHETLRIEGWEKIQKKMERKVFH
jgi:hypothetical protein